MVAPNPKTRKFELGFIHATLPALEALMSGQAAPEFLDRHASGDWGEVCPEDAKANDDAIAHEGDEERQARVLSAYTTRAGIKFWIITEADRSSTCILLPDEY